MIYYKYKADTKYTEDIFLTCNVYLSTSEGLNDPFECSLQEIGKEWIREKVKEMQQAGVAGFVMAAKMAIDRNTSFFGLSGRKIKRLLDKFKDFKDIAEASAYRVKVMKKLTGHAPASSQHLISGIDAQLLGVGIFSMSANYIQPLMWAHYAKEHSGICLGFEKTKESRLAIPEHFLPVIYSDKLPEIAKEGFNVEMAFSIDAQGVPYTSSFKISFSDQTFQKAITTKATCWEYEDEWRYVEPHPGQYDWPGPLVEVIFGLKCNEERRNHYVKLTEENVPYPVRFYEIRKKKGTNELERVPFEKPVSEPKIISKPSNSLNSDMEMTIEKFAAKMERNLREGKYGDVLFQVDENLKTYPNDPLLLNLKGTAHGYSQEPEKALECFTKLTNECPEISDAWYQKACALTALNRDNEAIEALKQAYKLNPNDPSISFNLGVELIKTQADTNEALIYLKRAESLGHRRAYSLIAEIAKD